MGLRNPNGMAWSSDGTLWTVANERDELGSDLVPDYLTSVHEGAFYGWPYSYYGQNVDDRVQPQRPELVAKAIAPDYALGPHTASLGLVSSAGTSLPEPFANGMFVGQHGSWNRNPHSGYKVIFVPFAGGQPQGAAVDVLTGFLSPDGDAFGRPVGVAIDKTGALLVADDVGNAIWRVIGGAPQVAARCCRWPATVPSPARAGRGSSCSPATSCTFHSPIAAPTLPSCRPPVRAPSNCSTAPSSFGAPGPRAPATTARDATRWCAARWY